MKSFSITDVLSCTDRSLTAIAEDITQTIGEAKFVGTTMLIQLSSNRLAKLTLDFSNRTYIHEPDAILVSIMNKFTGKIDGQLFAFKDYFVCKSGNSISNADCALKKIRLPEDQSVFSGVVPTSKSVLRLINEMLDYIQAFE